MRNNREENCGFVKIFCRRRTTDASAVFAASVFSYLHLSLSRTGGKKYSDSFAKLFHVISIEFSLSLSLPFSAALSSFGISQAFRFRLI